MNSKESKLQLAEFKLQLAEFKLQLAHREDKLKLGLLAAA
jgi:hypothetical protein